MADQLGSAVLTVSVDDTQFKAGLQAAERQAVSGVRSIQQAFGVLASGLAGIGIGAGSVGFLKSSIDAAIELETISRKLANTLGAQGAGGAIAFTRGLSDELGLSFKTLAGSFSGFTAAASAANVPLEVQKNLFAAVSKAAQQLGLSNDEINGSLLALQQIASKGTVQMEELRGQLGERLPIAFSAAAKGLGVTQQQLIKLIEGGKLTAQEFFPAITKGLNEITAASTGAPTAAQNFQKLSNAWDQLQTSFGQNLLPGVTQTVLTLTGALEGLGVSIKAREIRESFGVTADQATGLVGSLQYLQKQYNLTNQQAKNLLSDALASTGNKRSAIFGELNLDAKQFQQTLDGLIDRARRFRAANADPNASRLQREALKGELANLAVQQFAKPSADLQQIRAAQKLVENARLNADKAANAYQQLQSPKLGASATELIDAAALVDKAGQSFKAAMEQSAKTISTVLTEAVNKLTDARLALSSLQGAKDAGLNKYLNPDQQQLRLNTATASLAPDLERAISVATNLLKTQGVSLDKSFITDLRSIVAGAAGKTTSVGTINGQQLTSAAGPQASAAGLERVQQFIQDVFKENNALLSVQSAQQNLSEINQALVTTNADLAAQVKTLALKNWSVNVNVPGGSASGDVVGAVNGAF